MKNITLKIIGVNVAIFFLQLVLPNFTNTFVLIGSDMFARPGILLTSMFMHGSFNHLFFNMYALLLFGPLIEAKIGSKRFLYFYLITGLLAAIGYGLIYPAQSALGASGAIMGVIGMTIMLLPHLKILLFFIIPMSMRTAGIIFAAIDIFGLFNPGGVANLAHLIGLAAGLALGKYLLGKKKSFNERFTQPHKHKRKTQTANPNDVVIELDDNDVNDYLKNGRL
jgi:membrane associated rhomboid family serine protease